jgi:hypothetical protein
MMKIDLPEDIMQPDDETGSAVHVEVEGMLELPMGFGIPDRYNFGLASPDLGTTSGDYPDPEYTTTDAVDAAETQKLLAMLLDLNQTSLEANVPGGTVQVSISMWVMEFSLNVTENRAPEAAQDSSKNATLLPPSALVKPSATECTPDLLSELRDFVDSELGSTGTAVADAVCLDVPGAAGGRARRSGRRAALQVATEWPPSSIVSATTCQDTPKRLSVVLHAAGEADPGFLVPAAAACVDEFVARHAGSICSYQKQVCTAPACS